MDSIGNYRSRELSVNNKFPSANYMCLLPPQWRDSIGRHSRTPAPCQALRTHLVGRQRFRIATRVGCRHQGSAPNGSGHEAPDAIREPGLPQLPIPHDQHWSLWPSFTPEQPWFAQILCKSLLDDANRSFVENVVRVAAAALIPEHDGGTRGALIHCLNNLLKRTA